MSDYGYSKLMELLEAVPHVLQVSCGAVPLFRELYLYVELSEMSMLLVVVT